jgi:tetratricopeptide (TPR) repeat protein
MKQSMVKEENLPDIPEGWEWKRDATSPLEDSWVAVKKTLTQTEIAAIREKLHAMQEACFQRKIPEIQDHISKAKAELMKNTGPSAKAIKQAEDFIHVLEKLEAKEEDERRLRASRVEEERRTPLAATGLGFPAKHPLQRARRRLCAKVNLRRARALEETGDIDRAITTLRSVLRLEPKNPDALEALVRLKPVAAPDAAPEATPAEETVAKLAPITPPESALPALRKAASVATSANGEDDLDDDDAEDSGIDVVGLAETGGKYIAQQDYKGAMEVLAYAVKVGKWEGRPLTRLRCLSNLSLCLQKLRSSSELVNVATSALAEIQRCRNAQGKEVLKGEAVTQLLLSKMECAILSRRGWANHQLQHIEQGDADARRVKELLASLGETS